VISDVIRLEIKWYI